MELASNFTEQTHNGNMKIVARLSSILTGIVSIVYLVLCSLFLIYYFKCDTVDLENSENADYFWNTVYRVYLQNAECEQKLMVPGITQSYTVFVLTTITLTFSVLTLCTSIALTAMVDNKEMAQYLNVFVYAYIGSWVATIVVDLTLGTHLGMDIPHLSNALNNATGYVSILEVMRQGAFYLMAISLKGFLIHAIQLVLICLIIFYLYEHQEMAKRNEHPIHKAGPINAFDHPRRDHWGTDSNSPNNYGPEPYPMDSFSGSNTPRGQEHLRQQPAFVSPGRESFHRSNSWNHQGPSGASPQPFSYLDVPRQQPRSVQQPRNTMPVPITLPRVPEPDYSPHAPRRLKSALKPNNYSYM